MPSKKYKVRSGHNGITSPEEAAEYLKGIEEISVCGWIQIYNAFFDKDLVTDISKHRSDCW